MKESTLKLGLVIYFHDREEKNNWIIDSGCSNHITSDKSMFIKLQNFKGGLVKLGDDTFAKKCGKISINFDGKHNKDGFLYVKGLQHNLLSVGKVCSKDKIFYFRIMVVRSEKALELWLQ